jgi:hypothetical protein
LREKRLDLSKELAGIERLRNDRVAVEPFGARPVERLEGAGFRLISSQSS